jgi:hypothetical protein
MQRLSAPERTREELRALMNGDLEVAGRSDLVRLALPLIVEEALEGEVFDALGRERYERGEGEKAGYRNGYWTGGVAEARWNIRRRRFATRRSRSSRRCGLRFRGARGNSSVWRSNVTPGLIDARHRGRLHRRDGPKASVAGGGERGHRAAVGQIRRVLQA